MTEQRSEVRKLICVHVGSPSGNLTFWCDYWTVTEQRTLVLKRGGVPYVVFNEWTYIEDESRR